MIHFFTWRWGAKYAPFYVDRLRAGILRNIEEPFTFTEVQPGEDNEFIRIPGCFARLAMFDPEWQEREGVKPGERMVCLDLDLIITGPISDVFARVESFVILAGANSSNPCPYNGSVWMLRAGEHREVHDDFTLEAAKAVPYESFPDDQGWFAAKMPRAGVWRAGPESGVYAFKKPGWPKGNDLPEKARIVAFPGWRDPSAFTDLPWVTEHWSERKPEMPVAKF